MPQYELATSGIGYQLFPGEGGWNGDGSAGGNGLKGPVAIPTDYYSHPENYDFELDQSKWTFTEERRASIALYDYRGLDEQVEHVLLDGEQRLVQGPRTWRVPQIWDAQVAGAAEEPFVRYEQEIVRQAVHRSSVW